jgi:hypothetical protein
MSAVVAGVEHSIGSLLQEWKSHRPCLCFATGRVDGDDWAGSHAGDRGVGQCLQQRKRGPVLVLWVL